jgi:hypothetical protein
MREARLSPEIGFAESWVSDAGSMFVHLCGMHGKFIDQQTMDRDILHGGRGTLDPFRPAPSDSWPMRLIDYGESYVGMWRSWGAGIKEQ